MPFKFRAIPAEIPGDLRREASAPGVRVELVRLSGPRQIQFKHKGSALICRSNIIRTDGETLVGDQRSALKDTRGRVTFAPPRVDLKEWANCPARRSSYLNVYLEPRTEDFDRYDLGKLQPAVHFQDRRLTGTLIKFKEALVADEADDVTYIETLGLLLLQELCKWQKPGHVDKRAGGGLTPAQLGRIRDFISSHIEQPITVAQLADLSGVSCFSSH